MLTLSDEWLRSVVKDFHSKVEEIIYLFIISSQINYSNLNPLSYQETTVEINLFTLISYPRALIAYIMERKIKFIVVQVHIIK